MSDDAEESVTKFAKVHICVLQDKRLTFEQMRVLIALLSFRNQHHNTVWPSRDTLAKRARVHPSNVSQATKALAEYGWLVKSGDGRFSSSARYELSTPEMVGGDPVKGVSPDYLPDDVADSAQGDVADSATPSSRLGYSDVADSAQGNEQTNNKPYEQTIEKKAKKEEDQPSGALSATPSPKTRQKKTKSSICPQSFTLDPELRQWCDATAPGVNVDRELQKFMAHEFRTPKSNWNLAFKNWMLRAVEYHSKTPPPTSARAPLRGPMTPADAARQAALADENGFVDF